MEAAYFIIALLIAIGLRRIARMSFASAMFLGVLWLPLVLGIGALSLTAFVIRASTRK
jgi:hypothetical protein